MKGLSPNLAIFTSSSKEMHLFVMHYGIEALENFCKSFCRISIPANYGIILEYIYDLKLALRISV